VIYSLEKVNMKIGKKLRLLRKSKNMTLKNLSEKSGVQIATLSRMEHDTMTGTLDSHIAICKALGVSLPDFYREIDDERKTVTLSGGNERKEPRVHSREHTVEMLTTKLADKKMMPVLVRINKNSGTAPEECGVGSEKFVYILEGKILAKIGKEKYKLRKGNSVYFDASLSHLFQNAGKAESVFLSLLSPPAA